MASRNQVNLTLSDELAERLDAAVEKYSRKGRDAKKGRASVALEVLEMYLSLWEQIQQQKSEHLSQQIENALGKPQAVALPLSTTRRKNA